MINQLIDEALEVDGVLKNLSWFEEVGVRSYITDEKCTNIDECHESFSIIHTQVEIKSVCLNDSLMRPNALTLGSLTL